MCFVSFILTYKLRGGGRSAGDGDRGGGDRGGPRGYGVTFPTAETKVGEGEADMGDEDGGERWCGQLRTTF